MSKLSEKITITPRWYGDIPTHNGTPRPKNQWVRYGRKRKWCVRWYSLDGKRPRKTFVSREEANVFAAKLTSEIDQQGPRARTIPRKMLLGAFVAEVLELRIGPGGKRLSIGTIREYRTILNRFTNFVGSEMPLERIAMADATRYVASLQRSESHRGMPFSVSSINKHKRVLKTAFNIAVTQLGYLRTNPFTTLRQDKVADNPVRYVSPGEFAAIATSCQSMANPLWWECFVTVCYTAATRLNEAIHLTWADVDFEHNKLHIVAKPEIAGLAKWQPKDHDSRTIPVPIQTMNLLAELHTLAPEGAEYVFVPPERIEWIRTKREAGNWREGQATLNNVNKNFQRRASKAAVTDVSVHDLRRAAITHWARKLAVPLVKELAGHADISTTMRYYVSIREVDLVEAREVTAKALQLDPKQTQSSK